jgi:2-methylaconitate cis-trans-isomerase PrpF
MRAINGTLMRAGTSRGVYLLDNELPDDPEARDKVLLAIYGSPDKRQIDGIGGADHLTSKTIFVGPSKRPGIDVEYTFGQVAID